MTRISWNLGRSYFYAGRLDEAISSFRASLNLSPEAIGRLSWIGLALILKDEPEAALEAIQQESDGPDRLLYLPMAYHALGQTAESDAALTELIERFELGAAYNIAYVMAFRGDADRAFDGLDKATQYKDSGLSLIPVDPLYSNIHDDHRWLPFLESIGKSPEQLAVIEFEVRLPQ